MVSIFQFQVLSPLKNATNLQEIVQELPLDKILVETDSPYLAPTPYRGKMNQPAYTKNTAEFIAQLKNMQSEDLFKATTENFSQFISKMPCLVLAQTILLILFI